MKKILLAVMLIASAGAFTACSDDDLIETITPNDDPRFLDPVFPDRENGALATFYTLNNGDTLSVAVTVTPSKYTTVHWFLDGKEVKTDAWNSNSLNAQIDTLLLAGTYNLKIVAATEAGKSSSREGLVVVNPLATDPSSTKVGAERIVSPGQTATLLGSNLDQVTSLKIGDVAVNTVNYSAADGTLTYTVPASIAPGNYRITLLDAAGKAYGADKVSVVNTPLVTEAAQRANSGAAVTLKGVNLQGVTAVKVGNNTITGFTVHTANEVTFTLPTMLEGTYDLAVVGAGGAAVEFYGEAGNTATGKITITSAVTLWSGNHYISWDLPDGDAHKTFNLIPQSTFAGLTAGAKLTVNYTLKASDAYHKIALESGWWSLLPGAAETDVTADGALELTLTQPVLDKIAAEDGFLIVGHGVYVTSVVVE